MDLCGSKLLQYQVRGFHKNRCMIMVWLEKECGWEECKEVERRRACDDDITMQQAVCPAVYQQDTAQGSEVQRQLWAEASPTSVDMYSLTYPFHHRHTLPCHIPHSKHRPCPTAPTTIDIPPRRIISFVKLSWNSRIDSPLYPSSRAHSFGTLWGTSMFWFPLFWCDKTLWLKETWWG